MDTTEGECGGKWGGGTSGGFDGSVMRWGDEGDEDRCMQGDEDRGLWTLDFDWQCTVWPVAGDKIMHVGEGTVIKDACICGGENKTACDCKVD